MRIRIHPETTEGKPIQGTGPVLEADGPAGLVEAMHQQTPFTAEMPLAAYMDRVLAHVQGEGRTPLPGDPEAAAVEFLTRLARHARIEFLADDLAADEAQADPNQTAEVCPCAGKLA